MMSLLPAKQMIPSPQAPGTPSHRFYHLADVFQVATTRHSLRWIHFWISKDTYMCGSQLPVYKKVTQ